MDRGVSKLYKQPLTDEQLRASPIDVNATLDTTGLATEAKQDIGNTSLGNLDDNLGAKTDASASSDTGTFSLISLFKRALTKLTTLLTESNFDSKIGALTETTPTTDTASSGLNGRLQRIAQRLTSLINIFPTSLGAGGGLKIDGSGTPLPVSGIVASTPNLVSNATTTTVASSASSVILKNSNANRTELVVYNNADKTMYICPFTPATTSTPHVLLPGENWILDKYNGAYYAIWDSSPTGSAYVTEYYS